MLWSKSSAGTSKSSSLHVNPQIGMLPRHAAFTAGGGSKQRRKRALPPPELLQGDMLDSIENQPSGRKFTPANECAACSPPPQRRRSTGAGLAMYDPGPS